MFGVSQHIPRDVNISDCKDGDKVDVHQISTVQLQVYREGGGACSGVSSGSGSGLSDLDVTRGREGVVHVTGAALSHQHLIVTAWLDRES